MAADATFNTAATFTGNVCGSPVCLLDGSPGQFFVPRSSGDVVARNEDGTQAWTRGTSARPPPAVSGAPSLRDHPAAGHPLDAAPSTRSPRRSTWPASSGTRQGVTAQIASAINTDDGTVRSGWPVNVSTAGSFDAKIHNQRSALSLVNGILYIPYAGLRRRLRRLPRPRRGDQHDHPDDDRPVVHGGQGEGHLGDGRARLRRQRRHRGDRQPDQAASSATHADSEQVTRVTGMGTKADYFYPTNWRRWTASDADFGSVNPMVINVPGATPSKHRRGDRQGRTGLSCSTPRCFAARRAARRRADRSLHSDRASGMSIYGVPGGLPDGDGDVRRHVDHQRLQGCPAARQDAR